MGVELFLEIGLSLILVLAVVIDLSHYRIPNYLTCSTALVALAVHAIDGGIEGAGFSLAGLLVGMGILFPFYHMRMMGAGDVKLLGAVGAVLGPGGVFHAFVCTGIAGGLYALIVLALKRNRVYFKRQLNRLWGMGKTLLCTGYLIHVPPAHEEEKIKLCYAVAIALGTVSYLAWKHMGYSSAELISALAR